MRVLIIDVECMGLDFALRCADAGHEVYWYRYTKKPIRDGEGFNSIKIVDDWKPYMGKCKDGLIINTGNYKFLRELDRYRDLGFKIFAPTEASAKLEIERSAGMEAMKKAGIGVPEYKTFDSLGAALAFAKKSDESFVFKPLGDEEDKSLTYVSSDPADLVRWLERQIKRGAKMKGACMLQKRIDMMCEFGVSGWVGPDGFLPGKYQICIEHKKLMSGENGPNTGEMGTVCQYVSKDPLADELLKLEPLAKKLGHRGDFSIGAGIDKKGNAWGFEFTARFGYPAWFIQMASHKGDPAQWMRDLLDGKDTLRVSRDVAIGVVVGQPRFPYNDSTPEMVVGNPITGIEDVYHDVHMCSVMLAKGPTMKGDKIVDDYIHQTTGELVLVATGLGETVGKARKSVYGTVDKIKLPNMIFRDDIGEKVEESLPELHEHGYALKMEP